MNLRARHHKFAVTCKLVPALHGVAFVENMLPLAVNIGIFLVVHLRYTFVPILLSFQVHVTPVNSQIRNVTVTTTTPTKLFS